MRNRNLSILGLALILMGIVVSGCGAGSATSGDWKTYTNPAHGYAFAYPQDCFYGAMPLDCKQKPPDERQQECLCFLNGENPDGVAMQAFLGEKESLSLATLYVSHYDAPVYHPPADAELARWVKESFSDMSVEFPDEPNMEIDGVSAVRLYSPSSPMAPSYEEVFFFLNDVLVRISMVDVDNVDNKALYDQVLATFTLEQ